jgi:hypothetical protein
VALANLLSGDAASDGVVLVFLEPVGGALTAWPIIATHTRLMVLFGGMAPKNSEVNHGGVGRHESGDWLAHVRQQVSLSLTSRPRLPGPLIPTIRLPLR